MRLNKHIAYRFLTDDMLTMEIVQHNYPQAMKEIDVRGIAENNVEHLKTLALYDLVSKDNQKAYLVTDTVHDKLDMLKIKKDEHGHYDWTVFKDVSESKKTFILKPIPEYQGGGCLRLMVDRDMLSFCHIRFRRKEGSKNDGTMMWTLFYINRLNNEHAEHCKHQDVQDIYEFVYKLLCFIFLSENEYQEVKGGASIGTKKNGKFKNDLPIPVTIINSKWNVTVVRTTGFGVSGHFALRRCGEGRMQTKMVFIKPYQKHGYIRKAKNIEMESNP